MFQQKQTNKQNKSNQSSNQTKAQQPKSINQMRRNRQTKAQQPIVQIINQQVKFQLQQQQVLLDSTPGPIVVYEDF